MPKKKANKSKVNLELILVCDYAIVAKDGKLSILGVFEKITTKSLPARKGQFFLVAIVKGKLNARYTIETEVINPSGKKIGEGSTIAQLGDNGKTNFINSFIGMPIEMEGKYKFILRVDEKEIGSTEVEVNSLGGNHESSRRNTGLPN